MKYLRIYDTRQAYSSAIARQSTFRKQCHRSRCPGKPITRISGPNQVYHGLVRDVKKLAISPVYSTAASTGRTPRLSVARLQDATS